MENMQKEIQNEVQENSHEQPGAMLVVCKKGEDIYHQKITERLTIGCGRDNLDCDILVDVGEGIHFSGEIQKDEEHYIFRDRSKAGNVYYNGEAVGSAATDGEDFVILKEGDLLTIQNETDAPQPLVLFIFHRVYNKEVSWKSLVLDGSRKQFYISRHEERTGEEEVQPEDAAELPNHYALLLREADGWWLQDHNTRLGVYLNNKRIEEKAPFPEMNVARIGNTLFLLKDGALYYNHKSLSKNALVIHIEERSVWNLFRKKVLLEDIDLSITPGELVLILGGSGAGKTTFINAVMGYEKAKGEILSGDVNVYKNYNMMKYEIGFVPQQDLLRMEDEVYSTLDNAACLKMPKNTTSEERKARIKEVLELFGLEREADSLVSKLSGGQRKRLSIAVEYIANPSLFFLDEPDSGLDGVMARSLMENLRGIADDNKIVLVITHSPDRVADLFNKVIVLAKSSEDNAGHMAFYGGVDEAKAFFGTDSLEGVVKKINRTDEGGEGLADDFIRKFAAIQNR